MSSRALRALKTSLGGEIPREYEAKTSEGGRRTAGKRKPVGDGENGDEAESSRVAPKRRNTMAETSRRGREADLSTSARSFQDMYGLICFIFNIHANQERRSFHELQQAYHQLCGRKMKLDELRLLKTAYPGGLSFSYKGLASKRLADDLMIQIPTNDGGSKCFEEHKSNLQARLGKLQAQHGGSLDRIALRDLPPRPSNRSLEESEKIVRKVIQSYSPVRNKVAGAAAAVDPSSSSIKTFFQTNKIISSKALHMVQHTHDKTRKLFDQSELDTRRKRRNVNQLPVLFDRLRGLLLGLKRRAMPLKEVMSHLMSMRKDKTIQQSDLQEQLEMIISHADDWCVVETDTRNNKIFALKAQSNPNAVRRRLNLLSQQQ